MITRNLQKRLARIESRLHRPAPTVAELAELIGWSTPEVLEAVITHILSKQSFDTKVAHAPSGCVQCGYSGTPLQKEVDPAALARHKSQTLGRDVSIQELESAIERSSPGTISDAITLAFCEMDPSKTLLSIQCANCGHRELGMAEQDCPGISAPTANALDHTN